MWQILQHSSPDDFVLATGKSHSVREFVSEAFKIIGINIEWIGKGVNEKGVDKNSKKILVEINPKYFRPTEVDSLTGDYSKAKKILGWEPKTKFSKLVEIMVKSDYDLITKK